MAKERIINTKFWSDPFIQGLDPETKLVYLYLLTNERTSICGIYEITERTICFDTGLAPPMVRQSVDRLVQSGKIRTFENWVYLTNFAKHQKSNPSIQQGIDREIKALPDGLYDRLGTDWVQSGLLKPKLELELKLEPKGGERPPLAKKQKYLDFVFLTDVERGKLGTHLGEDNFAAYLESLNNYIGKFGDKYKSHYHVLLDWFRRDEKAGKVKKDQPKPMSELEAKKKLLELREALNTPQPC